MMWQTLRCVLVNLVLLQLTTAGATTTTAGATTTTAGATANGTTAKGGTTTMAANGTTAKGGTTTMAANGTTAKGGTTTMATKKTYTTSATVETNCSNAKEIVNNAAGKKAFTDSFAKVMGVTVKDTKVATMGCRRLTNKNRRLSTTGIKAEFTYESATNVAVDQKASDFGTELKSRLKAAGLPDAVTVQKIEAPMEQKTPDVSAALGAPATLLSVAILSAGISW
jgi:hypothetical protein